MTVRDDLARLELVIDRAPGRSVQHRERDMEAYKRVEAEIARLQAEAKHGERAWEQMRGRAEKAEAEIARLDDLLTEAQTMITTADARLLAEKDKWHADAEMRNLRAEAAEAEVARLRDGLRQIADGSWPGSRGRYVEGQHLTVLSYARALLADQDGAAKDAAPGVAATPTQRGASPEGNDGEPGAATIGGAA